MLDVAGRVTVASAAISGTACASSAAKCSPGHETGPTNRTLGCTLRHALSLDTPMKRPIIAFASVLAIAVVAFIVFRAPAPSTELSPDEISALTSAAEELGQPFEEVKASYLAGIAEAEKASAAGTMATTDQQIAAMVCYGTAVPGWVTASEKSCVYPQSPYCLAIKVNPGTSHTVLCTANR